MKIGFATTEFVTERTWGGQAAYLENITQIFSNYGHKVYIIVLSDHDEEFEWKKNITVCRVFYQDKIIAKKLCKIYPIRKIIQFFWNYIGISFVINRKVKQLYSMKQIELVQYSNLRGIPLFISSKIPSVIRLSNHPALCRHAALEEFDIKKAEKKLTLWEAIWMNSIKRADYVYGPSQLVASATEKIIRKKVDVIESPWITRTKDLNNKVYQQYLEGKQFLLFFGTLNYIKGIQVIAPVLDAFLDKYPNLHFAFVGKNAVVNYKGNKIFAKDYILSFVVRNKDRVVIIDSISEKEKMNYIIYKSEACILPSRIDNLPNTCIEAMALGKVVVGTKGASFEQLIVDGENGFLCERDNPCDLLKCMDKVMSITEEQKLIMGEKAKKRLEKMSEDKIYQQLECVYEKVMEERHL